MFAGDTVFHRQHQGDFDVVVAAYHDQALAAVELEFDSAVNLTLGLPTCVQSRSRHRI